MNQLLLYVALNGFLVPFGATAPSLKNGHVLVPARPLFERMKAEIRNTDDKVEVKINSKTVILQADTEDIFVDDISYQLPLAPQKSNGQLLIPLRSVMEALGAQVSWKDRFGSYRFIGITVPTMPIFKSPHRNHHTYSPDWLFMGRNVTLNVTVRRFLSSDQQLFEAMTEDGIL